MGSPSHWSTGAILELTSPENVPETGMQIEIECESQIVEQDQPAEDAEMLYCHCRKPWTKEFMIMCENCHDWFHGTCVSINENDALDIDKYHCSTCESVVGKTIYKNAEVRSIAAGTEPFISRLKERVFVNADDIICRERGQNLNFPNLFIKGFTRPILVDEVDGLGIRLPPRTMTVQDVERFVGPAMKVEVIQVEQQRTIPMTLRQFIEYFTSSNRLNRLNLISLEVSDTALGQLIEPPYIARRLDWVLNSWPEDLNLELYQRPKVSKYCLIGSRDSYTDFHIDFGGTSVWYHVLWGEKVFYLIEPTDMNIALFEKWSSSSPRDKYEAFFGDTVDYCYKLILKKGQTLFIPTGWIHAVLTTMDSLVFGGNFLHMLNMDLQLKVYNMEKKLNTQPRYMFPSFEVVHWLASKRIIQDLASCNEQGVFPALLRIGTRTLIKNLENWYQSVKKNGSELLPPCVDPLAVIKKLSRELRIADKRHATTVAKTSLNNRGITAATMTAELLNQEPSMTSFSGFLLGDGTPRHGIISSSSQDEMSSVSSPTDSAQPPIKLKLKKHKKHRQRRQSWSTENSKSSVNESAVLNDNPTRLGVLISSNDASQSSSPKDGGLKIRLSLSEARMELVGATPPPQQYSLVPVQEDSESDNYHIDTDTESVFAAGDDKKKYKSRRSHHHRKKHRTHHHRKHRPEGYELDSGDDKEKIRSLDVVEFSGSDDDRLILGKPEKRNNKNHKRRHSERCGDEMKKVHQDDQYIYPSLMVSDDDEGGGTKRRRITREADEAWSPSGRIGKFIPKAGQRPSRPGAKREAVEKGLSEAATTLASNDALNVKRKYKKRSPMFEQSNGTTSSGVAGPSKGACNATETGRKKKLPKGMATAKQRLSKILKINRLTKF